MDMDGAQERDTNRTSGMGMDRAGGMVMDRTVSVNRNRARDRGLHG